MRKYSLISLFLLLALNGHAQKRMGLVLNPQGQGIAHVSIQDGKSIQLSDALGFFNLNTEAGNYQFSHLGYSARIVEIPAGRDTVTVVLYPLQHELDTVTVFSTGYSNIPKERATGSFAEITRADLDKRITTSILDNIEGMAPGLQFSKHSSAPSINIRGINSLDLTMSPLIVVDNFPFAGDVNRLNPEDIASVTLLKDAAAASIWGARAGNGVIVIKTKTAQRGKLIVDASVNTRYTEKANLYYQPNLSSPDFIAVERMLFKEGFYNGQWNSRNKKRFVFSPAVDLLYKHKDGLVTDEELETQLHAYGQHDYRDELSKLAYQNPFLQQYNLSISRGAEQLDQRLSIAYSQQQLSHMGTQTDRFNGNWSTRVDFNQKLSLHTNLLYSHQQNQSARGGSYPIAVGGGKTHLYPYAQLSGADGEALAIPYHYNYEYIDNLSVVGLKDWKYRPLDERNHHDSRNYHQGLNLNTTLKYKLTNGLSLEGLYAIELNTSRSRVLNEETSYMVRNLYNRFAYFSDGQLKSRIPEGGLLSIGHGNERAQRVRTQISYDTHINQHRISLFSGAELADRLYNTSSARHYGYNKVMTTLPVDGTTAFPIFDGLARNATIPTIGTLDQRRNRFVSIYANGAYDFKGRYVLTGSLRRDAANVFGVKTNERWNLLWSAGLLWHLDKEAFMQRLNWLDELKLKTTYGHSGNTGGVASSLPVILYMRPSDYYLYQQKYAVVRSLPNESLRWEDVAMLNLGLDLAFWKKRVQLSLDYYFKNASDLLTGDDLDPTTGYSLITRNVGQLKGRGFDLQLRTRNLQGRFRWETTLMLAGSTNKLTKYYGKESASSSYTTSIAGSFLPVINKPLYPVYAHRFMGLDPETGDPQGWHNGELSTDYTKLLGDSLGALSYKGTGIPIYHGSFQNTFSYKNFELWTNLTYKFGHYFRRETIRYQELFNRWQGHVDFKKRWQEPGDELHTTVPAMSYPANSSRDDFYASSEANVDRGDLLRLQDLRLSYSFKINSVKAIKRLSIYLNAHNLGILWKSTNSHVDPDYPGLPPARAYAMGFKLAL